MPQLRNTVLSTSSACRLGQPYIGCYSYDTLNRLTSGPGGSYTYGDSAHLDAATAITGSSNSYTASYDAAGDMTCRAPTSSTTCSGTQMGAQLSYDNERRLATWQNAPGSAPTSSTSNLYDGEGHRVAQQVTNGGATTTVTYVGNLEELSSTAGTTTTTSYYYAGGKRIAQATNGGAFSYLGSDGLGSAEVALDGSGNVQASALYDPYGNVRYSSGTMPGTYGYTGQRADAATGLDYYHARYYDSVAGQFTSADSAGDGLNRYAYVGGNPETATDPTGHYRCDDTGCTRGGGNTGGSGGCTYDCGSNSGPYVVGGQYIGDWAETGSHAGSASDDWVTTLYGYRVYRTYYSDGSHRDVQVFSDHKVCDTTCRTDRNDALKANQIDSLNKQAIGWGIASTIVAGLGALLLGDLLAAAKALLGIVTFAVGAIDALGTLPGDTGLLFARIGSVFSGFLARLYAAIALTSAVAFVTALLEDGLRAALTIVTGGLGSIVGLGVGAGLTALGFFFAYQADNDLAAAQEQDDMSIGAWCSTAGSGQCQ